MIISDSISCIFHFQKNLSENGIYMNIHDILIMLLLFFGKCDIIYWVKGDPIIFRQPISNHDLYDFDDCPSP